MEQVPPLKDEDDEHPIASAWRPSFGAVVAAFSRGDYDLTDHIEFVAPIATSTSAQARAFVAEYGETLVPLPQEAWETSVAQCGRTRPRC